ncbi:MAG: hypothetical protein ABIN91_11825 [Mucilaginibacter sp.]|uniref:hypothetical protein n=1 Tax=Mucilaginibacter sp. TaxID=1882438 RepID=UPI00326328CE
MRSSRKLILAVLICLGCLSCGSDKEKGHPSEPVTLTSEDDSDVMSFKRGGPGNMVNTIYGKLLVKRPELKRLEDDMIANDQMQTDSLKQFDIYRTKSNQYYASALENIKDIKDSVLRKEFEKFVTQNKTNYEHKISTQTTLLGNIEKAEQTLKDNRAVLKLIITLPIIEQYQQTQLPANKKLEILLQEKQKLISRTKKLASTGD